MADSNRFIHLVLLVAAAMIAAIAIGRLRTKRQTVEVTAQAIHDQLDALDPVTRGAVVARLTGEAVRDARARKSGA